MKTSFANEPAYRAPTKTTDDNDQSTDKSLKETSLSLWKL